MRIITTEQERALQAAVDLCRERESDPVFDELCGALQQAGYQCRLLWPADTRAASCNADHSPLHNPIPLPE